MSERASRMANHHFATVLESLERAPLEVCAPHVSVCTPTRDARRGTENGIPQFQSSAVAVKHTNAHTLRTPKHEGLYRNATAYSPFATRMDGYPLRRETMEYGRAFTAGAGLWCLTIPRYLICTSHAYLPDCYSLTFIKWAPCTALSPPGRLGPGGAGGPGATWRPCTPLGCARAHHLGQNNLKTVLRMRGRRGRRSLRLAGSGLGSGRRR